MCPVRGRKWSVVASSWTQHSSADPTIPSEEPDLPFHPRGASGSSRKTLKTVTEGLWAA